MLLSLLFSFGFSWNQEVNILASEIAFRRAGDAPHTAIQSVLQMNNEKYERDSIVGAWISSVELPPYNTKSFNHWRFTRTPLNRGEGDIIYHSNEDDLISEVTAINSGLSKNTITDLWSYTLAFKSFFGLYMDLFAPLHNAELFNINDPQDSSKILFTDGDNSGQKFFINYNGNNISLYDFWESGCGRFNKVLPYTSDEWHEIDLIVDQLRAAVPSKSIPSNFTKIHDDSTKIANSTVYDISVNQNVKDGDDYYNKCIQITNERIVIGAYSLSNALKRINVPSFPQKMPEQRIGQSEIVAWGILALLLPTFAFLVWTFCQLKVKTD